MLLQNDLSLFLNDLRLDSSFLGFALGVPQEVGAARSAGLFGQWLVASTSLEEPGLAPPGASPEHGGSSVGPPGLCREGHRGPASEWTTDDGGAPDGAPLHSVGVSYMR